MEDEDTAERIKRFLKANGYPDFEGLPVIPQLY